jgi:hypothetical protein
MFLDILGTFSLNMKKFETAKSILEEISKTRK